MKNGQGQAHAHSQPGQAVSLPPQLDIHFQKVAFYLWLKHGRSRQALNIFTSKEY